jgi:hypothetical protein
MTYPAFSRQPGRFARITHKLRTKPDLALDTVGFDSSPGHQRGLSFFLSKLKNDKNQMVLLFRLMIFCFQQQ